MEARNQGIKESGGKHDDYLSPKIRILEIRLVSNVKGHIKICAVDTIDKFLIRCPLNQPPFDCH